MHRLPPLTLQDKALVMHTVTWVKTVNDAKPAGAPASYPSAADIDSSALFKRIREGLAPMPWAPPTSNGQPNYELIENARGRHRVIVEGDPSVAATVAIDGARWHVLGTGPATRDHRVAFGRWPVAYRLLGNDAPRWPQLPGDLDDGSPHDVVRLPDGRLVAKDLVRRTRDEVVTEWSLQCVSPLDERLYLHAERQPLDDPEHYRPTQTLREHVGAPSVFASPLRQGLTVFFPLARDPWTGVTRHVGVRADTVLDLSACLARCDAGDSPLDCLPQTGAWQVFEIGHDGQPLSAWRTDRREWLAAVGEGAAG
ncbi:MAG: hypothetical protein JSS03_00915 [Proteobacteria bacterium]|nr:hypothetical protein [Pseudomonadota bacterium]